VDSGPDDFPSPRPRDRRHGQFEQQLQQAVHDAGFRETCGCGPPSLAQQDTEAPQVMAGLRAMPAPANLPARLLYGPSQTGGPEGGEGAPGGQGRPNAPPQPKARAPRAPGPPDQKSPPG